MELNYRNESNQGNQLNHGKTCYIPVVGLCIVRKPKSENPLVYRCEMRWWLGAELNRRHKDFQFYDPVVSPKLPTRTPLSRTTHSAPKTDLLRDRQATDEHDTQAAATAHRPTSPNTTKASTQPATYFFNSFHHLFLKRIKKISGRLVGRCVRVMPTAWVGRRIVPPLYLR